MAVNDRVEPDEGPATDARPTPDDEPSFGPWHAVSRDAALARLPTSDAPAPEVGPRIVAVDGRSAAGKTTLAAALADALPDARVVHTDDVAWHHSFFDWQRPLIDHVLAPLRAGRPVSWRPDPWVERDRAGSIEVPAGCRWLILEGVGASRRELDPYLDARVWVWSDPAAARARELARHGDSPEGLAFVEEWMVAERAFVAARRPWERCDLVVCGTPDAPVPAGDVLVAEPHADAGRAG